MTYEEAVRALGLKDPLTDELVSPRELTAILKEDVVLAARRPGSWEGANMLQVLTSHGFFHRPVGCFCALIGSRRLLVGDRLGD